MSDYGKGAPAGLGVAQNAYHMSEQIRYIYWKMREVLQNPNGEAFIYEIMHENVHP